MNSKYKAFKGNQNVRFMTHLVYFNIVGTPASSRSNFVVLMKSRHRRVNSSMPLMRPYHKYLSVLIRSKIKATDPYVGPYVLASYFHRLLATFVLEDLL